MGNYHKAKLHLYHFSADLKILWMTGSHGTEDGRSALTDIDLTDHALYEEDCKAFGIKPGPKRSKQRPPLYYKQPLSDLDWMSLHKADITKPALKIQNALPLPDIICNEELKKKMDKLMKKMDIRVVNMTYYYKNKVKLMSDISKERLHNNKIYNLTFETD